MKKVLKKIASGIIAAVIAFSAAAPVGAMSKAESLGHSNYELLQQIIDLYLETSLYETTREELVNSMIYNYLLTNPYMLAALANSLLSANDPYSAYYLSEEGFMSGESKGFGIVIKSSDAYSDGRKNGVYIDEILKNSNAEFAGVLPGDRFVSVEGINVEGLSMNGIKSLISILPFTDKDPQLSKVFNDFSKENYDKEKYENYIKLDWNPAKEVDFVFERILSDGSEMLIKISMPKGVSDGKCIYTTINPESLTAVIEITAFGTTEVANEFKAALTKAENAGCKNIIFDLRDNPGGFFDQAITMADLFTEGGKVMFYTNSRADEAPVPVNSTDAYIAGKFEKYAVLINENTASAAELFAYILKSQAGAAIIGETSYGKAVGQDVYNVVNGDSFSITTFEILQNDLASYNEIGLSPDVEVPLVLEKYEFPTELSHFNHDNYVTVVQGAENDAVLALEQRFGILGLLDDDAIDGKYDDSTKAAVMIYKYISMNDNAPTGEVTHEMVTSVTSTINTYKDKYFYTDSQLDTAELYLENKSRGKRLAKEYINAKEKYEKEQKRIKEERMEELKKELEAEREAMEQQQASGNEQNNG